MRTWILLVFSLMICGCSGVLTREKASKMIADHQLRFRYPVTLSITFGDIWNSEHLHKLTECGSVIVPEILWARDHGFVTVTSGPEKSTVTLTDKGKRAQQTEIGPSKNDPCDTSMLSIAELGKPNVTGMIVDGITARVEFDYQVTPINESDSLFSDPSKVSESEKRAIEYEISSFPPMKIGDRYLGTGTATLHKYDDGWRVESVVGIRP